MLPTSFHPEDIGSSLGLAGECEEVRIDAIEVVRQLASVGADELAGTLDDTAHLVLQVGVSRVQDGAEGEEVVRVEVVVGVVVTSRWEMMATTENENEIENISKYKTRNNL